MVVILQQHWIQSNSLNNDYIYADCHLFHNHIVVNMQKNIKQLQAFINIMKTRFIEYDHDSILDSDFYAKTEYIYIFFFEKQTMIR